MMARIKLELDIEEIILKLIDEADNYTRSDLQGIVQARAKRIVSMVNDLERQEFEEQHALDQERGK